MRHGYWAQRTSVLGRRLDFIRIFCGGLSSNEEFSVVTSRNIVFAMPDYACMGINNKCLTVHILVVGTY